MRRLTKLFIGLSVLLCTLTNSTMGQWTPVDNENPTSNTVNVIHSSPQETVLMYRINAYALEQVLVENENAFIVNTPESGRILKTGAPDLPLVAHSVIIPDREKTELEIINSDYVDITNVDIAPSKGNLTRDIDPATVPFQFGEEYNTDAFYPSELAKLSTPYILRDYRGQAIQLQPFHYNPITKVLRIYTHIELAVRSTGEQDNVNTLNANRDERLIKQEFASIYDEHFVNNSNDRYTILDDKPGNMLIICYGDFMDEMAPFVEWKKQKGIPTDIVDVATIGTAAQIKTYVQNYYTNNGLTYLLLVGDDAQVPTSSTSAGDSDNNYGYTSGTDHYIDLFVGRFSAETGAQVTTMVDRNIHYEKNITASESWMANAIGSASAEGSSSTGDDGESDAQHMNNIETDLQNYGYNVTRVYQTGGSVQQMTDAINAGKGMINYVGHGSNTSWVNVAFGQSQIDALTNINKLPFIMDVACVNGNFKSITCFAETWLRATHNNEPAGALAIIASTINQAWAPPMRAQDEFNDILVDSYVNNKKRTFGGLTQNGIFDMIDHYGSTGNNMSDTWTIFGDPSVMVRTKQAGVMNPSYPTTITAGSTTMNVTNVVDEALVCLTLNGNILDRKFASGTSATLNFTALPATGTCILTVTAYNKVSYQSNITIGGGTPVAPVAAFSASSTTINTGQAVTFTDQSTNAPTAWNWTFTGGTPSSSTQQNPSVTYDTPGTYSITLSVSNSAGSDTETKTNYITVDEAPITYCASQGNNYSYEWISKVEIGNFVKTSAGASYSDFTGETINLSQGASTAVTLTPGFSSSTYTEYWKIWIDYNKDGDFTDAGEEVFAPASSTSTVSGNFTVKADATGTTRMRVSMKYNGSPTPCEAFSYGEVEDYTVTFGSVAAPVAAFTASATTITAGQSVTFTDQSTNGPTSWSWTFDGGTPSSSTSQNPSISYNTAGTYNVSLIATNAGGSDVETKTAYITVEATPANYCNSQGNNFSYEWISKVEINGFTKSSAGSNYSDYTSDVISLSTGSNAVSLTPAFSSSTYVEYWRIWIDWNNDGDFVDADEEVFAPASSSTTISGSFTPLASFNGQTRMRVSMKWNAAPTSCESFSYGEVEDYTISINRERSGTQAAIASGFTLYPNPANTYFNLMGEDISGSTLYIFDVQGRIVINTTVLETNSEISTQSLKPGVYMVKLIKGRDVITKKLVVKK